MTHFKGKINYIFCSKTPCYFYLKSNCTEFSNLHPLRKRYITEKILCMHTKIRKIIRTFVTKINLILSYENISLHQSCA